jgi:CRP-like cAMP-binding protein
MKREEVWRAVEQSLRPGFGRLLDIRDVRRVRRVAGDAWSVTVVLAAPSGDLHVADLNVDDAGHISPTLTGDDVIEAARRAKTVSLAPPPPDELADFGLDDAPTSESDPVLAMLDEVEEPIEVRAAAAIARGDRASLNEARNLLPQLLAEHERQGQTLFMMAEVELKLGEKSLAKGYLEASAREFADRFDMDSLEKAAALALEIEGREAFSGSPIHELLEQSRARLKPIEEIGDARSFKGIESDAMTMLSPHITLRTLGPGETLVSEGESSRNVFVVKSGLLGVWLEKPSGGSWLVRCCFPGWLLGESSVLGAPGSARCTATLRAERVSEVWVIPAEHVRAAMLLDLAFGLRMGETKQMHRIDSFFSMHETMSQLDVQVRDEMLSCIQRLETFESETVLLMANVVPDVALLVARGELALYQDENDTPVGSIKPDHFYGVRDAIHSIAPSISAIALAGTTVAFFDAARLQRLCERSPEQVAAVLERLG